MAGRRKIVRDVGKALREGLLNAGVSASVRERMGESIEAEAVGKQALRGAASQFVMEHAKASLCSRGYATTVTCEQQGDEVRYIFEVNRERVFVGIHLGF